MVPDTVCQALTRRLDTLEMQNRRLRAVASVVALSLSALLIMGLTSYGRKTVTAERFVLKDGQGRVRMTLSETDRGNIAMGFTDAAGRPRTVLLVDSAGSASVGLSDSAGKVRLGLNVGVDGAPSLFLVDGSGGPLFKIPYERNRSTLDSLMAAPTDSPKMSKKKTRRKTR